MYLADGGGESGVGILQCVEDVVDVPGADVTQVHEHGAHQLAVKQRLKHTGEMGESRHTHTWQSWSAGGLDATLYLDLYNVKRTLLNIYFATFALLSK